MSPTSDQVTAFPKLIVKDEMLGDGCPIEIHDTLIMWYTCEVSETGEVFQSITSENGPPVELSLFRSLDPAYSLVN